MIKRLSLTREFDVKMCGCVSRGCRRGLGPFFRLNHHPSFNDFPQNFHRFILLFVSPGSSALMLTSFFSLMCFSFAPSWVVPDILFRFRLQSTGLALTIFRNSLTFPLPHLTTPLGKTAASPQRLLALSHPKSVHHHPSRRLL